MSMDSMEQLFTHELKDIYSGEQQLVMALEELREETSNGEFEEALSKHTEETRRHVERIEKVFEEMGESPEERGGQALSGIVDEHRSFVEMDPSEQLHEMFDMGASKKVEHYEISAYEDLVRMAEALDMTEAADQLQQNLTDEHEQLDRLKKLSDDVDMQGMRGGDQPASE